MYAAHPPLLKAIERGIQSREDVVEAGGFLIKEVGDSALLNKRRARDWKIEDLRATG